MAGRRAERVGRQVVQALAQILEGGAQDPRLALVTFTAARMGDDLRSVRVFFSCIGNAGAVAEARAGLAKAEGYLRSALAQRLALRYVPSIVFEYDDTLDRAERIDRLLQQSPPQPRADREGPGEGREDHESEG